MTWLIIFSGVFLSVVLALTPAAGNPQGQPRPFEPRVVEQAVFSPDGRYIATVSNHAVTLWDVQVEQPE
jgi:hypothetical protein